ncbi:MAG: hypothetical protein FJ291_30095 [Planctomycetes bacterium]|nr:hypothetical protein [Planctomycetota bacterium]
MSNDVAVDPQVPMGGASAVGGASVPRALPQSPEQRGAETPRPQAEERGGQSPRPQAEPEAGLPEEWREHVRELRGENARRRKENQELRAQLAALDGRAREAEAAAQRDAARLATVHRRLKEAALARLTRQALDEAAHALGVPPSGGSSEDRVNAGLRTRLDAAKVERLLELVPAPVELDADLVVTDEGEVTLSPEASERLKGYAAELAELASVEAAATGKMPVPPVPPPVGGEPPRASEGRKAPVPNAWETPRRGQAPRATRARDALVRV